MGKKSLTVKDIKEALESIVPLELQETWDNSGLLIGFEDRQVSRIMTCLELNTENVEEAINQGVEMIITHHPLIFERISSLNANTPLGAVIIRLIRHGISVYSCHTPFDKVNGGNNDALAGLLELKDVKDLSGNNVPSTDKMLESPSEMHIGRIGKLKKTITFEMAIYKVCQALNLQKNQISAVGELDTEISKVGLCTGAGVEFAEAAWKQGCQLFITGDVKYHQAQNARDHGICVIDAGHYGTEKIFPAVMKVQLEKVLDNRVDIIASETDINPFVVL